MTGPQHYDEAERLLGAAATTMRDYARSRPGSPDERVALDVAMAGLASAQVHATLALAAASAPGSAISPDSMPGSIENAWVAVLS